MEVEVKQVREKSEAELEITISGDELASYIKKAAEKLSKEKGLKGFRPGKAPVNVVAEAFGEQRLLNEAAEKAVPRFFVQAALDNNIDAIARPSITVEKLGREEGLAFTAKVAVLPEITLGDVSAITGEKKVINVSDEEVEKELNSLAKTRSNYLPVARPAQKGDTVTVDFKVLMEGTVMEGGESKNHPVHLGEGHFVSDFEKNLIGIKVGETREFEIEFPADFAKKALRGKKARAWVVAHEVQKQVVPEINDEWARKLGKFKDLAALKYALKSNLIQEKERKERDRWRGELAEKLAGAAKFTPIHDALIDKEIDRMIEELTQMLAWQQKTWEEYLATSGKKLEEVRAGMRPSAERSVKVGLALRAFSVQQNIEVLEAEVTEKVDDYLKRFASPEKASGEIEAGELKENISFMLRNQKALERLEEIATVKISN